MTSVRAGYSRIRHLATALAAVVSLTAGCGGQATEGEESGGAGSRAATSGTGGSGSGSGKTPNGGLTLGNCTPGFDLDNEPWRECAWMADGLCYDTKPAACACICPRNRNDSVCSSGFEGGPDGRVEVHCQ